MLAHLGALAQLAAIGLIGSILFTVLATFLGVGVGLLPVVGIGVL